MSTESYVAPTERSVIKVATWNILHSPSKENHKKRIIEAAAYLESADVVLLQEVSRGSGYNTAKSLADKLDMELVSEATTLAFDNGHISGTAIISKLPMFSGEAIRHSVGNYKEYAVALLESPSGRPLNIASAHLEWGGDRQQTRLAQVAGIDQEMRLRLARVHAATGVAPVTVLGGDFNTTPNSDPIRFLVGEGVYNETSTLWVDSWAVAGDGTPGYTNHGDNPLSALTASNRGCLDPSLIPKRRIDYLMVHGWVYGKAGCPLRVELIGERPLTGVYASDHNGIIVDLWDPPLGEFSSETG